MNTEKFEWIGRMTARVEQYRLSAAKCLDLADRSSDPESKRSLLVMANAWLMLAAQRVKNIETLPYSFTCARCQSGMVWYKPPARGLRRWGLPKGWVRP